MKLDKGGDSSLIGKAGDLAGHLYEGSNLSYPTKVWSNP